MNADILFPTFTTLHPAPITIWPNDQDTLFGRRMTPAERLRQHQRSLQKAQRELERERAKLEQQEKKTMADIKKNAKAGNMVRFQLREPST